MNVGNSKCKDATVQTSSDQKICQLDAYTQEQHFKPCISFVKIVCGGFTKGTENTKQSQKPERKRALTSSVGALAG